jgi:hypothetical protein
MRRLVAGFKLIREVELARHRGDEVGVLHLSITHTGRYLGSAAHSRATSGLGLSSFLWLAHRARVQAITFLMIP